MYVYIYIYNMYVCIYIQVGHLGVSVLDFVSSQQPIEPVLLPYHKMGHGFFMFFSGNAGLFCHLAMLKKTGWSTKLRPATLGSSASKHRKPTFFKIHVVQSLGKNLGTTTSFLSMSITCQ